VRTSGEAGEADNGDRGQGGARHGPTLEGHSFVYSNALAVIDHTAPARPARRL
jgi:hypothetical protein